jgi:diacylglycerol kinase (ATP)
LSDTEQLPGTGVGRARRLSTEPSVLLVNTAARQGAQTFERARKYLTALDLPLVEAWAVERPEDLPRLVRAAVLGGARRVVVGGGDGTLSSAANELWNRPVRLGVLPLGTCNDFARSLGLPLCLEEACRVAAGHSVRRVDVGTAGKRVFLNAAGIGLSTAVTRRLNDDLKRRLGRGAFAVAAATEAVTHRPFRAVLRCGPVAHEVEAHVVVVGNGRFHGGGQLVAPNASHEDHQLDVYVIRSAHPVGAAQGEPAERLRDLWNLIQVAVKVRRGTHLEHPAVLHLTSRSLHVEAEPAQDVDLDGELWGQTPTRFEVRPAALEVLAP